MRFAFIIAAVAALAAAGPASAQEARPVEFHGLVQIWFTAADSHSTFRVRRTELKATGPVMERVRWTVQIDPSKLVTLSTRSDSGVVRGVDVDNGSVLQDAILSYEISPGWAIDAGQFKIPLTREGTASSATLETVERALFATAAGKFADVRDLGVRARGVAGPLELHGGLFNGVGESFNRSDANTQKALVARAVLTALPGLALGASAAQSVGRASAGERNRWGVDASFATDRVTLRGEVLGGRDAAVERFGYYGLAAFRVLPRLDTVLRYDAWDNGISAREDDYVAGLSYLLDGRTTKLQLNLVRKTFAGKLTPAQNLLLINAQAAF